MKTLTVLLLLLDLASSKALIDVSSHDGLTDENSGTSGPPVRLSIGSTAAGDHLAWVPALVTGAC